MRKFLIPATLAAIGLVMLSKRKATPQPALPTTDTPIKDSYTPTLQETTPDAQDVADTLDAPVREDYSPTPTSSGNMPTQSNLSGVRLGIRGIEVDYSKWKRLDWARYYATLLQIMDKAAAQEKVWQDWNHQNNFLRNLFPNKVAFLYNLVTTTIPANVGTNTITWQSQPVYATPDNYYNNLTPWGCADWKTWHQALKQKYGRSKANTIWAQAWQSPQNQTVSNNWAAWFYSITLNAPMAAYSTSGNPATFCPGDCELIEYLYSQGMDINSVLGYTGNAGCNLENIVVDAASGVSNVFSLFSNLTAVLKWAIPIGLVVGGVVISRKYLKNG